MKEGVWVYLVSVLDHKKVVYYVDGKNVAEVDAGGDTNVKQSPGLWLGAEAGALGKQALNGVIDELWISNKAINKDDVTALSPDVLMAVTLFDRFICLMFFSSTRKASVDASIA